MKLWDKGQPTDQKIDQFTVGMDRTLDLLIAPYDVQASKAHAAMLAHVGLITQEESQALIESLNHIGESIEAGELVIEDSFEDVHSKIEFLLTQELGETGKKIHAARSRNDQVLVACQLYLKAELEAIKTEVLALFELLMDLAEQHKNTLMPGYTHLQVAMPSSFGLWFSAYAEGLVDDLYLAHAAYKTTDQNPLGSAAGYGSSFPIDREMTTRELGFSTLKYNVVAAQMGRGKTEKAVGYAMASLGGTLGRLAMDICLYMGQDFGFISFPDQLTTGSSIMPHKKNPDVFELIRGKCNRIQAVPNELTLLINNLPSGYHRDMQLTKEILFPAMEELRSCMEMMKLMLNALGVRENILTEEKYKYLFSVEKVNELVNLGIPFRDAYAQVGNMIDSGTFHFDATQKLNHTHEGSIGNLCTAEINAQMQSVAAVIKIG